jgi:hypothetical protein
MRGRGDKEQRELGGGEGEGSNHALPFLFSHLFFLFFLPYRNRSNTIKRIATDFCAVATRHGRTIIREMFLPQSVQRTIPPIESWGVAGGLKYMKDGIFFKFAVDNLVYTTLPENKTNELIKKNKGTKIIIDCIIGDLWGGSQLNESCWPRVEGSSCVHELPGIYFVYFIFILLIQLDINILACHILPSLSNPIISILGSFTRAHTNKCC